VSIVSNRIPVGTPSWPVQFIASPDAKVGGAVITLNVQPADPGADVATGSMQWVPFINHSGGDAWRAVRTDRFIMAVTDQAPFAVELQQPSIPLVRGGELAIRVKLMRRDGFNGPIEFKCDFAPAGVVVPPAETIPGEASEAVLRISASPDAKLGEGPLFVTASTVTEQNSYLGTGETRVSSQLLQINVAEPFAALASEPSSVRRGGSAPYRWAITPKSGFDGEAEVRLLGLPKGVSVIAPLPRITAASREVVFQLEASEEALLGLASGVECELTVRVADQEIRQRTGKGNLRIDPKL
jgi:hypothetical protein